jgi:hypothetical protein
MYSSNIYKFSKCVIKSSLGINRWFWLLPILILEEFFFKLNFVINFYLSYCYLLKIDKWNINILLLYIMIKNIFFCFWIKYSIKNTQIFIWKHKKIIIIINLLKSIFMNWNMSSFSGRTHPSFINSNFILSTTILANIFLVYFHNFN